MFEELLRVDPSHHLWGQRVNFWVSLVVFLASSAFFVWWQRPATPGRPRLPRPPRPRRRAKPEPKRPAMAIPKGRVRHPR
jgi:hypothetical protein